MNKIILAGDGHGAYAAYEGLIEYFDEIYIHTYSKDIFIGKREGDCFINDVSNCKNEIFLSAGYKSLVTNDFLKINRCLNIHYALLPKYRGMHPIVWGIINQEEYLGWTLHKMDKNMDSGDIIHQHKVTNDNDKNAWEYMLEFDVNVSQDIGKIISLYLNGEMKSYPQKEDDAVWGAKRNLADCQLNFEFTHEQIQNFFRALVRPYPLPYFKYKNEIYFINKYSLIEKKSLLITLGRICNIDDRGLYIKVRDGYLLAEEILDHNYQPVDYQKVFKIGSRL